MISKYKKIVGNLELIDVDKDRDNLIYSYLISDTFDDYDFDLSIDINLTTFLYNVGIDEDYSFIHIEDNIEDVEYKFIMTMVDSKKILITPITKDKLKETFILLGVEEKDVEDLIEEIIKQLTDDAIDKLNYLVARNLRYYFREDERIC